MHECSVTPNRRVYIKIGLKHCADQWNTDSTLCKESDRYAHHGTNSPQQSRIYLNQLNFYQLGLIFVFKIVTKNQNHRNHFEKTHQRWFLSRGLGHVLRLTGAVCALIWLAEGAILVSINLKACFLWVSFSSIKSRLSVWYFEGRDSSVLRSGFKVLYT